MIWVEIVDGYVLRAGASRTKPEGALEVVPAKPVAVPQEPLLDEEGIEIPQPDLILPFAPEPGQIGWDGAMPEPVTLSRCMVSGDVLVPRPWSPVAVAGVGQIVVPPCPAGTKITVYDLSGQDVMTTIIAETDDYEEVFEFPDAGDYEVEVSAPLPHLTSRTRVTF